VDALKADLAQSQKQYFEMVELAGKESHRVADLEDEVERLKSELDNTSARLLNVIKEIAEKGIFHKSRAAEWKTSARTWRRSSTKWQGMYEELKRRLSTEGKSDDCLKQKLGLQGPQPKDRNCQ
jgi:hypothetical protein